MIPPRDRLWKIGLYAGGAVAPTLTGLLILPLYARALSVAGFGAVVLISTAYTLFSALTLLGLNSALVREYHDYPDPGERRAMIGALNLLVLLVSAGGALLLAAGVVLVPSAGQFVLGDSRTGVALLAAVFFIAQNAFALQQAAARASGNARRFALVAAAQAVVLAVSAVLLVGILRLGVPGYLLASITAALGGTLTGLAAPQDRPRLTAAWRRMLTRALAYGAPLVAVNASGWALGLIDRYLVNSIMGIEATGQYGMATRLGSIANLIILVPLSALLPPTVFQRQAREGTPAAAALVYRVHLGAVIAVGAMALALSLSATPLLQLVGGSDYVTAAPALVWLAWSAVAFTSVQILGNLHAMFRRTGIVAALTLAAAMVKVAATVVLLPRIGLEGAGIASFIAYGALACAIALTGRRLARRDATAVPRAASTAAP